LHSRAIGQLAMVNLLAAHTSVSRRLLFPDTRRCLLVLH
jgi:hypothetical protein